MGKERDFPGIVLRYEDNQDIVNQLAVVKMDAKGKSKMEDYGTLEQFLKEFSYLLGQQSYNGKSISEGGFAPDRVSAASVLISDRTLIRRGALFISTTSFP